MGVLVRPNRKGRGFQKVLGVISQASESLPIIVGYPPSPTNPGPQQARIAIFDGSPTGLFQGFLREVSREIVYQARFAYPEVLRAKKPACLELV